MQPTTLEFVANACGAPVDNGCLQCLVSRVCTDSRQVRSGDLFVAIAGDRFDGHAFVADAVAQGAVAVLVGHGFAGPVGSCAVIRVDDTRKALGLLAARYRQRFAPKTVAVAGSNGKTSTKELIASVLRQDRCILQSPASFNNDIGVPLTLLELEPEHEAMVVELGTNHPGELAPLVSMVRPDMGVITSIGREHLEYFGDLEGVVREEGMLAEMLPAGGRLFLNGDTMAADRLALRSGAPVVRVGFGRENEWRITVVEMREGGLRFSVEAPTAAYSGDYRLSLLGRHQAVNAVLALAIGAELGVSRDAAEHGLERCRPAAMRLQWCRLRDVDLLDDAYNANADSMLAALQTLGEFPCSGRRLAVLGDMAELGAHAWEAHAEVGRQAAVSGVEHLFAVGRMAPVVAEAARGAGLSRVREFVDVEAAADAVRDFVAPGDVVLLKASRAARLERVGDALRRQLAGS